MELKRKTVTLQITQRCNLNCIYCYEHYKKDIDMPLGMAKDIIEHHQNNSADFDEILIEFHGGEPFVVFDLIREICEWTWSKQWTKPYLFFATTNGTLVHDSIQDWLKANKDRFWLSLSLDGTKDMHDLNRSESFSAIDIEFFKAMWPLQSVKMTVSSSTLPSLSSGVIYLHSLGFSVKNNLAYGIDWSSAENIKIFEEELFKLVTFYLENPHLERCGLLSTDISYILYDRPISSQKWCGCGTHMFAYDHEGSCWPCHFFLPASIGVDKSAISTEFDFRNPDTFYDKNCESCVLLNMCPTCYGVNYSEDGHPAIRNKHLCKLTKLRFLALSYLEFAKLQRESGMSNINSDVARKLKAIKIIQDNISV